MPIIKMNASDMMKGQPIAPGWYKAKIVKFEAKPSKAGDSMNFIPTLELEDKFKTELDHYFSQKAIGTFTPFVAAARGIPMQQLIDEAAESGEEMEIDTDEFLGKQLQVEVVNDTYEGRLTNKMKAFLPYDAAISF